MFGNNGTIVLDRFQTDPLPGYDPMTSQGALAPPVFMTSTFAFETTADSEAVAAGESDALLYGRENNPTQAILEARLANLEGAEAGVVFASGMGAVGGLLLSLLSQGDELVVHRTLYSNTYPTDPGRTAAVRHPGGAGGSDGAGQFGRGAD